MSVRTPDPMFTGDAVGVTPMVSFVSVLLWSLVLGPLGALLALIAGVGRTSLAMARNRDLPSALSSRRGVPLNWRLAVKGIQK